MSVRAAARLPRPVTHVVFDLDGVLLDTEGFYTRVTQEIVGRYGKVYDWSIKGHMLGRPATDAARYLVHTLALPITPEDFLIERDLLLAELFPESLPMPGARELTAALAARGVGQAVATSTTREGVVLKTGRHRDWFRLFDAIIAGDDPRVGCGKPAPDIFLVAAEALGVAPAHCVVVEDAPAGIVAAHAAGMQVIAVRDPGMDPARLADAELVVGSLAELTPGDLGFPG